MSSNDFLFLSSVRLPRLNRGLLSRPVYNVDTGRSTMHRTPRDAPVVEENHTIGNVNWLVDEIDIAAVGSNDFTIMLALGRPSEFATGCLAPFVCGCVVCNPNSFSVYSQVPPFDQRDA